MSKIGSGGGGVCFFCFLIFIKGLVVLNLNVNGCLVKEILRKLKENINKGKGFVKKRVIFLKLRWLFFFFFCHVATKIQILFNILILDTPTIQTVCHIAIFR